MAWQVLFSLTVAGRKAALRPPDLRFCAHNVPSTTLEPHHSALHITKTLYRKTSSYISITIAMSSSQTPAAPARKKRYDQEYDFMQQMYADTSVSPPFNPSITHTMEHLQGILNTFARTMPTTACRKSALCALRRIITAWKKYPAIGSDSNTTKTSTYDFRKTAFHVVRNKAQGSLEKHIAKVLADHIDPPASDVEETYQITQARVDNVLVAAKRQWYDWAQEMIEDGSFEDYERLDPVLSEDDAEPITYTMAHGPDTLNPPSDPSTMLPQNAEVDNELADRQIIYVTGRVLRSKAEKINYAAGEKTAAAQARAERGAAKAVANAPDGKAMQPSSPTPEKKSEGAHALVASTPTNKGKKHAASDDSASSSKKRAKKGRTAGSPDTAYSSPKDEDDDDSDNEDNSNKSDNNPNLTVAPDQTKPGGAAKAWLRDEDDWGHNIIIQNPDWPMPTIYRELNKRFANTAYQDANMMELDYRGDYVRFPSPNPNKDSKKTREYDLFHRSYQSVRQHFEKFKKDVGDPNVLPPYEWTPCPENLAVNSPARYPPPRPDVFRDPKHTPVPRIGEEDTRTHVPPRRRKSRSALEETMDQEDQQTPSDMAAQMDADNRAAPESGISPYNTTSAPVPASTAAPAAAPTSTPTPAPDAPSQSRTRQVNTFQGQRYYQVGGWTPINAPVSGKFTPYNAPASKRGDRAAAERAAGQVSTIDPRARVDMTAPQNFNKKKGKGKRNPITILALRPKMLIFLAPDTPETMRNSGDEKEALSSGAESAPGDGSVDTVEDFVAQQSDADGDVSMGGVEQAPSGDASLLAKLPVTVAPAAPKPWSLPPTHFPRGRGSSISSTSSDDTPIPPTPGATITLRHHRS